MIESILECLNRAKRAAVGYDWEVTHGYLDDAVNHALRLVVADATPENLAVARAVVAVLDQERDENWGRWYA